MSCCIEVVKREQHGRCDEFCIISQLLYDGSFPINYEGFAFEQVGWKKMSIAAIVAGCYIAVPVDSHVRKFYGIYAKSNSKPNLDYCADVFKVRTNPTIG